MQANESRNYTLEGKKFQAIPTKHLSLKQKRVAVALVGLLLVAVAVAFWAGRGNIFNSSVADPQQQYEQEALEAYESLSRIMLLPQEEPTIATVVNVDRLKQENPLFYKDAENGDRLFLFVQNRQAILFRPQANKIINITSLDVGDLSVRQLQTPALQ